MGRENYYRDKINKALSKHGYSFYIVDDGIGSMGGKKPFDGFYIKNGKVMAVEFKKDYHKLENHQRASLAGIDAAAVIIRVMQIVKEKEIIVSYPSGSVVFSTPLKYKVFAKKFHLTFGMYFIKEKLSKYTAHMVRGTRIDHNLEKMNDKTK